MDSGRRRNLQGFRLGGEVLSAALDAEQTARIVALESESQDHSARLRAVEDAILTIGVNVEIIGKAARVLIAVLALGLGLNVGELSGVIS